MGNSLGITQEGLKTALRSRDDYRHRRPLILPGHEDRMLIPENLMNQNISLSGYEDPLPLAMMATRDPEAPMALAAAARRGAAVLASKLAFQRILVGELPGRTP